MSAIKISQQVIKHNNLVAKAVGLKNITIGGGSSEDATAVVKDADGNILDTIQIASGATEDINLILEIV